MAAFIPTWCAWRTCTANAAANLRDALNKTLERFDAQHSTKQ
jgi:hypothetical protein